MDLTEVIRPSAIAALVFFSSLTMVISRILIRRYGLPSAIRWYIILGFVINIGAAITLHLLALLYGDSGILLDDPKLYDRTGWLLAKKWRQGVWANTPFSDIYKTRRSLLDAPIYWLYAFYYYIFGHSVLVVRFSSALVGSLVVPLVYVAGRSVFDVEESLAVAKYIVFLPPLIFWSASPVRVIYWTVLAGAVLVPVCVHYWDRDRDDLNTGSAVIVIAWIGLYVSEPLLAVGVGIIVCIYGVLTYLIPQTLSLSNHITILGNSKRGNIYIVWGLAAGVIALLIGISGIPMATKHSCTFPGGLMEPECLFEFSVDYVFTPSPMWVVTAPKLYSFRVFPLAITWAIVLPLFVLGVTRVWGGSNDLIPPLVLVTMGLLAGIGVGWWVTSDAVVRYRMIAWPFIFILARYGWRDVRRRHRIGPTEAPHFYATAGLLVVGNIGYAVLTLP